VARAALAGVDLVVAERVVGDVAVLVADEAVARDQARIEVDLQLDVLRDDLERAAELLLEHTLRGVDGVDATEEDCSEGGSHVPWQRAGSRESL
jgi:hypothetical protein